MYYKGLPGFFRKSRWWVFWDFETQSMSKYNIVWIFVILSFFRKNNIVPIDETNYRMFMKHVWETLV